MSMLKHVDFEVPSFGEFDAPAVAVSSYAQAILALNPLAYWRLNEQSGQTLADQTDSHPLTLIGDYTLGESGVPWPHRGHAVRFNLGLAKSTGSVLPTSASAPFSIVFWIRTTGSISTWRAIAKQHNGPVAGHMALILRSNGLLRYLSIEEGYLDSIHAISTEWTMVVLTRDATGEVRWYADGILDNQDSGYTNAVPDIAFILASYHSVPPELLLTEVAVFDQTLSSSQIQSLYAIGSGYFFGPASP